MAAVDRLSPVSFSCKTTMVGEQSGNENGEISNPNLDGAQLSPSHSFRGRGKEIRATPLILDFRRLLDGKSGPVMPGVSNRELMHAVVGLYDVSLSDMQLETTYDTVCDKWARTIVLLRDAKDVLDELNQRNQEQDVTELENKEAVTGDVTDLENKESGTDGVPTTDVLEPEPTKHSKFADVFSDVEDDEEEEDGGESEEEDYSDGINSYLKQAGRRRKQRKQFPGSLTLEDVGIENRLVAALTFKKTFVAPTEKVIHLTLVSVRNKFRKLGIGKYLLQQLKDPEIVASYDAIVVHADNSAVDFFSKYGFSDDIILNSKWGELAEQFTNCSMMCYLPPFTGQNALGVDTPELDIVAMEKEIKKWREKTVEAYQAEASCMTRLRHEVIHLRAMVSSQQDIINSMVEENRTVRQKMFQLEKEFLQYRLQTARDAFQLENSHSRTYSVDDDEDYQTSEPSSAVQLMERLEEQVEEFKEARKNMTKSLLSSIVSDQGRAYRISQGGNTSEPYDGGRDMMEFSKLTDEFKEGMQIDPSLAGTFEVKMITKAFIADSVKASYEMKTSRMTEPARLYYCGGLERPQRLRDIMKHGFSEQDFSHGEYGRGLYFSKSSSKAAQYSPIGKLVVASVSLGKIEPVTNRDRARVSPAEGFDSIETSGRLNLTGSEGDSLSREYVIFDVHQALPIFLLDYIEIKEKP